MSSLSAATTIGVSGTSLASMSPGEQTKHARFDALQALKASL